jgi:hypothetical protein
MRMVRELRVLIADPSIPETVRYENYAADYAGRQWSMHRECFLGCLACSLERFKGVGTGTVPRFGAGFFFIGCFDYEAAECANEEKVGAIK